MSNTLTKNLTATILDPGVVGSPGTPPTPAFCTTRTTTVTIFPFSYLTLETGEVVAVPGTSYPSTETVTTCYPATPGVPPVPGRPPNVVTQYNLGWREGARSIATLAADGTAAFSVSQGAVGVIVGLDSGTVEFSFDGAEYALYFQQNSVAVLENGVTRTGYAPYVAADVFRIERSGPTVRYYKNTTLLYTSQRPSYGTTYLEATMFSGGDAVLNASLVDTVTVGYGESSAGAMLPVAAFGGIASASGTATLLPVGSEATGLTAQGGTAALRPIASVGSAAAYAAGTASFAPLTSTGIQSVPTFSLGSAPLGYLISSGLGTTSGNTTGEAAATTMLPMQGLASQGTYGGGIAALRPVGSFSTNFVRLNGWASLSPPAGTLFATGFDSTGDYALEATCPSPTLAAFGGATLRAAAPSPALTVTATVTNFGAAALSAPLGAVAGGATVTELAGAQLVAPAGHLVGYSGAVVSITLAGRATLLASGTTGGVGGAQITCPLFELTASATMENYGGAELLAPSPELARTAQAWLIAPGALLTAIGSATVVATYEAYAVNLNHTPRRGVEPVDETTHYTSYPFDRIVRYKNSYFGMNSTGLYLLEGTTDAGAPMAWTVRSAETDFGSTEKKTVEMAYFGGRMAPAATVNLYAGESAAQPYSYTTPRGALAQNYRQTFGRGIKARYYAFGVSGTGTLDIDSVTMNVTTLTRKV